MYLNNRFCISCQWYIIKGHDTYLCARPPYYGKINLVSGKTEIIVERSCENERNEEHTLVVEQNDAGKTFKPISVLTCGQSGKYYLSRVKK